MHGQNHIKSHILLFATISNNNMTNARICKAGEMKGHYSTVLTNWVAIPDNTRCSFYPKYLNGLRDPTSFLFNRQCRSFPCVKWPWRKSTIYTHPAPRLRMKGAIPLLPLRLHDVDTDKLKSLGTKLVTTRNSEGISDIFNV